MSPSIFIFFLALFSSTSLVLAGINCTCDHEELKFHSSNNIILKYKIGAIAAILAASALGVSLPIVGKKIPALHPNSNLFFLVKSFAAGVILSTGFIHILPDAYDDLTNPCLKHPWKSYPAFTGLFAIVGALGSLMIDAFATGYYRRAHYAKPTSSNATHGATTEGSKELDRIRYKVTSQVLEMGIVVHSVIIGISMGTSHSLHHIKSLIAALCFHQFFEGVGLAGCIVQASFKSASTLCMVLFFSLTTPVGIGIGTRIAKFYDESNPIALVVQGLLNSIAAGILIYMALVDLLAQDFIMSPKVQTNTRIFIVANITLLLGAGFMAVLAKWD